MTHSPSDEDLLFDDRAGERAGEVRHVVADRVVVAAVVRRHLLAAVAVHVVHRAQARRELPVEGEDVLAGGGEVLPPLGAEAEVEGQPVERELVLHEEAEALRVQCPAARRGLEVAVVVDRAVRGCPRAVEDQRPSRARPARSSRRGSCRTRCRSAPDPAPRVNRADEPVEVARVDDVELQARSNHRRRSAPAVMPAPDSRRRQTW